MRFNKILKLTLTTLLLTLLGSFSTTSNASSADDPKLWRSLIPSWVTESLEKHQDLTIELLLTRDYNTFIGKEGQYTELPADFFSAIKFFGVYRLNRLHGTPLELLDPFLSGDLSEQEWEAFQAEASRKQKFSQKYHTYHYRHGALGRFSSFDLDADQDGTQTVKRIHPMDISKSRIEAISTASTLKKLREMGLSELYDHRDAFPWLAEVLNPATQALIDYYIPFTHAKIHLFKTRSFYKNYYREFIATWADYKDDGAIGLRPVSVGIVSSGSNSGYRNSAPTGKGSASNTPDGKWGFYGFSKFYKNYSNQHLPGMWMLSYGDPKESLHFSNRGFHLTGWGYANNKTNMDAVWRGANSGGCIRHWTDKNGGEGAGTGYVNVHWAAFNPNDLHTADHLDGLKGSTDRVDETPIIRQVVREFRRRIEIESFSQFTDSSSNPVSAEIRAMYESSGNKTSPFDYFMNSVHSELTSTFGLPSQNFRGVLDKLNSGYVYTKTTSGTDPRWAKYVVFPDRVRDQLPYFDAETLPMKYSEKNTMTVSDFPTSMPTGNLATR